MAENPSIPGYELIDSVGHGPCGEVFRMKVRGHDRECAVKVFDGLTINRQYLSHSLGRLFAIPQHPNLVDLIGGDLNNRPYYLATGFYPASLGSHARPGPTPENWGLVRQVAEGLTFLHRNGVLHCNLTFENIRLTGATDPQVKLADFATGWIAGIHHLELASHPYYAAPEQLRHPEKLNQGNGERWDVYSFGVVAFRILTGQFPRGERSIREYMRLADGATPGGARPTAADFASLVENEPSPQWPVAPADASEQRRREVIDRCLALAPEERFADMRDVLAAFEEIEREEAVALVRGESEAQARRLRARVRRARSLATLLVLLLAGSVGAGLFFWKRAADAREALSDKATETEAAVAERDAVEAEARAAVAAATAGRQEAEANLGEARASADFFIEALTAFEPDTEKLAAEHAAALDRAVDFTETSLARIADDPLLVEQRIRAEQNLASLYRLQGRDEDALEVLSALAGRLVGWLDAHPESEDRPAHLERLAEAKLEAARLLVKRGDAAGAVAAIEDLERRFGGLVEAGTVGDRVIRALASGWFVKATSLRRLGRRAEALEVLGQARETAKTASAGSASPDDELGDALVILETGRLLGESGKGDESVQELVSAVEALIDLTSRYPDTREYRFQLTRAYGELGRAVSAKGNAADASRAFTEAIRILGGLVKAAPEDPRYRLELAVDYGEIADLVRDTGDTEKAAEYQEGAVAFLKDLYENDPGNEAYAYHYAHEQRRQAELLADEGKNSAAEALLAEAVGRLEPLTDGSRIQDPEEQARVILLAELYGALGHANEEAKEKEDAIAHFRKALAQWELLAKEGSGGASAPVEKGLAWSRERLKALEP